MEHLNYGHFLEYVRELKDKQTWY